MGRGFPEITSANAVLQPLHSPLDHTCPLTCLLWEEQVPEANMENSEWHDMQTPEATYYGKLSCIAIKWVPTSKACPFWGMAYHLRLNLQERSKEQ